MLINTLQYLTLKVIGDNLYLLSRICLHNCWYLPDQIGVIIFEFVIRDKESFIDDELEFFSNRILNLTNARLYFKNFSTIKEFHFFNDHTIKNLYLNDFDEIGNLCLHPLLEKLSLINCPINCQQAEYLGYLLKNCYNLKSFIFRPNNQIGKGFKAICDGLMPSSICLKEFILCIRNIKDDEAISLAKLLGRCKNLEILNIPHNYNIGRLIEIYDVIRTSTPKLKELVIPKFCLNKFQACQLGDALKNCKYLKKLIVSDNEKMDDGFLKICDGLKSSCEHLTEINVSNCNLNRVQRQWLSDLLMNCKKFESLFISEWGMLSYGLESIFSSLISSKFTLKLLDLSFCSLNTVTAESLGDLLNQCTNFESLDLTCNQETGKGLLAICDGLKNSRYTIKHLNFFYCSLRTFQIESLVDLLKCCVNLELLNLSGNINIYTSFYTIFNSLSIFNKTQLEVELLHCGLDKEQKQKIEDLTRSNPHLKIKTIP